jgi:hypothetical protein
MITAAAAPEDMPMPISPVVAVSSKVPTPPGAADATATAEVAM